jgi:hypothetical protein
MVTKLRERLAVSKQKMHRVHMERFSLKNLNEVEGKEQYRVEISESDTEVDISGAWETIRENIKTSSK